jgi:hypothetical protein
VQWNLILSLCVVFAQNSKFTKKCYAESSNSTSIFLWYVDIILCLTTFPTSGVMVSYCSVDIVMLIKFRNVK